MLLGKRMYIETEYNRENRVGTQIWISDDSTTQMTHSYLAATNQSNTNYDILLYQLSYPFTKLVPSPNPMLAGAWGSPRLTNGSTLGSQ